MAHKQEDVQNQVIEGMRVTRNDDGSYLLTIRLNSEKMRGMDSLQVSIDPADVDKLVRGKQGMGTIMPVNAEKLADAAFKDNLRGTSDALRKSLTSSFNLHKEEIIRNIQNELTKIVSAEFARAEAELTTKGEHFSYNSRTNVLSFDIPKSISRLGICTDYVKENGSQVEIDTTAPFISKNVKGAEPEVAAEYLANLVAKRLAGTTFPPESLKERVKKELFDSLKAGAIAISNDAD